MNYYVGYVMRLGTEENARLNGLRSTNPDVTSRAASIGHKIPGVSDTFSDFAEHNATCVKIEDIVEGGKEIYMECTCGNTWHFTENDTEMISEAAEPEFERLINLNLLFLDKGDIIRKMPFEEKVKWPKF